MGIVVSGSGDFDLDGEIRRVVPGDTYHAPPGVPHGLRAGAEGCVVIDVFSPPRAALVELIAQGLSSDEVGVALGISPRTAKAHCDVLRQKLGVTRRRQIPIAFRLLTGEDPLASRLASARADNGG